MATEIAYPAGRPSDRVGVWFPVSDNRVEFIVAPRGVKVAVLGRFGQLEAEQAFTLTEMERFAFELLGAIRALRSQSTIRWEGGHRMTKPEPGRTAADEGPVPDPRPERRMEADGLGNHRRRARRPGNPAHDQGPGTTTRPSYSRRSPMTQPDTEHDFSVPDILNGSPVLRCARRRCRIVWWPDRRMPQGRCMGAVDHADTNTMGADRDQPDTRPTADDFTAVTTNSRSKRHWSLTRYMERGLERNPRPGLSGYALCGGYGAVDQERLTWRLGLWGLKPVTISDLPPCKQCDKSRNRRVEGRRS